MYLARLFIKNNLHYRLRESYLEDGIYRSRDLIDLGADPGKYIIYPGGSSFYVDEQIFDRLKASGVKVDYDEVESCFLPFLDPYIRMRIDLFLNRTINRGWKRMDQQTRQRIFTDTHVFDRRRIHFLRFGQTDLRELDRSPALFKILLDKSRDELEQLILEREQDLRPQEYKRYIFAIFDLQHYFTESCARTMPHALDSDRLDDYFLREVCRLDSDKDFWQGMEREQGLFSSVIRYVIMFFDYSFAGGQTWQQFARAHFGSGRRAAPLKGSRRMSMQEVTIVFGLKQSELATMSRSALIRLYRKKAHQLHPDKGGDHNQFIELTTAYNELLRTKSD
jgi:hypothetical protein